MANNTKKKHSAARKLIPAAGMLAVSAAMLASSTYAWFTMNKEVQVTNMEVKAIADKGLLINEVATYNDTHWDNLATTTQNTGITLHATSTANTNAWYVAYSTKSNTAAAAAAGQASADLTTDGYKPLGTAPYATAISDLISATAGTSALTQVTYVDSDNGNDYDDGEGYYVKYTYYLKSSGDAITCSTAAGGQTVNIEGLAVEGNTNSADLDKALRVAIVANNKAYIYAPLYEDANKPTYYVNASSTGTTPLAKAASQATALTSIPATSDTSGGTPVYVYLYFEGEDTNLKTDNVTATLDNLTVSFKFALVDNATAASDNGVAVSTS